MKQITKLIPDPGAQSYDVVNMAQDDTYIHPLVLPSYTMVEPYQSIATDIAFFDGEKVIIVRVNDYSKLPKEWVPIGVVVVPGTHNVYGDGSCGVMSLKEMNYSTPDTGSTSYQQMYWGNYDNDISNLPNLTRVPIGNQANGLPTGETAYAIIPSDGFNSVQCTHDTDAYYYGSSYSYIPSPYLTDESRNPGYYQTTSPSSVNNCLADFDGRGNSQILWNLSTAQSDWRTASTIINDYSEGYSPAACCCWRYHTDGTQQGDWYLPAMGELGYIIPKFNKINEAITKIRNAYRSSVGVEVDTSYLYWSSSEHGIGNARFLSTGNGYLSFNYKSFAYYVRAFLRVGSQPN